MRLVWLLEPRPTTEICHRLSEKQVHDIWTCVMAHLAAVGLNVLETA